MTKSEALSFIYDLFGSDSDDLVEIEFGSKFDKLIFDIADLIKTSQMNQSKIKEPYILWFFNGESWIKTTKEDTQEKIYREWYNLTSGGKKQNNSKCETYYYLGHPDEVLVGRHKYEDE